MPFKLAYSTLHWRSPDLEVGLNELKKAGWDGWECRLPLDWIGTPSRLRRVCENAGMPMLVFTEIGSPDSRDPLLFERNKRRMEFAAEMDADCFMVMNTSKDPTYRPTVDDLRVAAAGAEEWAEYADQFGLELTYHPHTNTLVDSIEDLRTYLGYLDKAKLCIDVSHIQLWGYDPKQLLKDYQSQLNYVHLQDWTSTSRRKDGFYEPQWCEVGDGETIDFPGIRKTLEDIGYSRIVTAVPGLPPDGDDDPINEAKRSKGAAEYLRGIGY